MTPSGIEPATFRFVAQYHNHCVTISGPPAYKVCILNTCTQVARYEISTALLLRYVIFWHVTLCIGVNGFPCSIVRILEVVQTLEEVGMQCLEERNP
jgi:hypothetical protein